LHCIFFSFNFVGDVFIINFVWFSWICFYLIDWSWRLGDSLLLIL
jgi:hypothetical protein